MVLVGESLHMAGCHDMTNGGNPIDVKHSVSLQFPDFLCDLVNLLAIRGAHTNPPSRVRAGKNSSIHSHT